MRNKKLSQETENSLQHDNWKEKKIEFLIPLILTVVLIVLTFQFDLDLVISRQFFDSTNGSWPWKQSYAIDFVYSYGPLLPFIIFIGALIQLILSFIFPRFLVKRLKSSFIVISILVVPLFLTHSVIKEAWKRPRPRDTIEFAGNHKFHQLFEIADHSFKGKSFTSGHAAAGFVLTFLFFLYKKRSRKLAYIFLTGSILFGCWISFARIAVGGHYFTDTYFAFVLCWYFNFFLYYAWYLPREARQVSKKPFTFQKWRIYTLFSILTLIIGLFGILKMIIIDFRHDLSDYTVQIPPNSRKIELQCSVQKGNIKILREKRVDILIKTWVRGSGPSDLSVSRLINSSFEDGVFKISIITTPTTWFWWKYQSHLKLYLPQDKQIVWDNCKTKLGIMYE